MYLVRGMAKGHSLAEEKRQKKPDDNGGRCARQQCYSGCCTWEEDEGQVSAIEFSGAFLLRQGHGTNPGNEICFCVVVSGVSTEY